MATGYPLQAALPTCKHHPNEELLFFCNTCRRRVCEECCRPGGSHMTHEWRLSKKFAREVRQNTEARCEELEILIKSLDKEERETVDDIERFEHLRIQWNSAINEATDLLKEKRRAGRGLKTNMSEELKVLRKMLQFFRKDIHEADDNVAVEVMEEFYIKKEMMSSLDIRRSRKLVFREGTLPPEELCDLMGKVVEEMINVKVKVRERSHFIHIADSDYVNNIVPISSTEALLTKHYGTHICLVNTAGKVIKETQTSCGDFVKLDNDVTLFTLFKTKVIRRLTSPGTVDDFCSTEPLRPSGICTSQDGGVYVCLCNSKSITSDSMGEVHHVDSSGMVIQKFTHDKHQSFKSKLFINPDRLSQNLNKDLCVVDTVDNEFCSRLVVITTSSELKFMYKGQTRLPEKFSSNDVCCDELSRILVSDVLNHAVHLLREDGHFIQYVLTEDCPVWGPRSLAVHGYTLWVGCEGGVVRVYKYDDEESE